MMHLSYKLSRLKHPDLEPGKWTSIMRITSVKQQCLLFPLFGLLLALFSHHAFAQSDQVRLALVIGNSRYVNPNEALAGASADASEITQALKKHQFLVRAEPNLSRQEMMTAIQQFKESLETAGSNSIGFFYYAGHGGVDSKTGNSLLLPANAEVKNIATDGLSVQWIQTELQQLAHNTEKSPAAVVVVIDACRTLGSLGSRGGNPTSGGQSKPTITAMTKVAEPEKGFLFAFSTSKNQSASDKGQYAQELIAQMSRKGLTLEEVFKEVQHEVYSKTGQFPVYQPNIVARICLVSCESDIKGPYAQNKLLFNDEEKQASVFLEAIKSMDAPNRCQAGWARILALNESARKQATAGNLDTAGETYKKVRERAVAMQSYLSTIDMVQSSSKQLEALQQQRDSLWKNSERSSYMTVYRGLFKDSIGNLENTARIIKRHFDWSQIRQVEAQMEAFAKAEDYVNAIERAIEGHNFIIKEQERAFGQYIGQPIPKNDRIQTLLAARKSYPATQKPLLEATLANTPGAQACNN